MSALRIVVFSVFLIIQVNSNNAYYYLLSSHDQITFTVAINILLILLCSCRTTCRVQIEIIDNNIYLTSLVIG